MKEYAGVFTPEAEEQLADLYAYIAEEVVGRHSVALRRSDHCLLRSVNNVSSQGYAARRYSTWFTYYKLQEECRHCVCDR